KIDRLQEELRRQGGVNDRLQVAQEHLQELLREYTEKHPYVIQQRALIANLANQTVLASTNLFASQIPAGSVANAVNLQIVELNADKQTLGAEIKRLEKQKELIKSQAKGFSEKAVEY